MGSTVGESEAILGRFLERGGNFIDTANGYTKGTGSDHGDYFARDGRRDRILIATKFSTNLYPRRPQRRGRRPQDHRRVVRAVAAAAQTDYIDLYWMHVWDPNDADRGDHAGARRPGARRQGALRRHLRHAGVEGHAGTLLAEFRGWSPFVGLQIEYSLVERTVEGELVPMARELGLGVTPWSPLRGGVLSGKYTRANAAEANPDRGDRVKVFLTERNLIIIDELVRIAGELGTSPASVALAWLQSRPA